MTLSTLFALHNISLTEGDFFFYWWSDDNLLFIASAWACKQEKKVTEGITGDFKGNFVLVCANKHSKMSQLWLITWKKPYIKQHFTV